MSETTANNIEKSTFRALWRKLDHNQRRFAVAMLGSKTKKEAAESIEVKPNTVYNWNGDVDSVIEMMQEQRRDSILEILAEEGAKAAMVKIAGLDSEDEIRRQNAATEILDRILGKAAQPTNVSGAVTVKHEPSDFSTLTDDELDTYIAICRKLGVCTEREPEA